MKTYRRARQLLAPIEETLAAKYRAGAHPLARVVELLCAGTHCGRVELVLDLSDARERRYVAGAPADEARPEIRVPIRLGTRRAGELVARAEAEHGFRVEDRVLLKATAARVALFLATKGKYIGFAARMQAAASQQAMLRAAAGEKSRR